MLDVAEGLAGSFLMLQSGRIVWSASAGEPHQSLEDRFLALVEAP